MQQYKEMMIRKPMSNRMPTLELNGKWLNDIGFTIGTMIYAHFADSCLTLSTNGASASNIGVVVVKGKRMRGKVRPQLLIDGFMLKRLGFTSYDRIGMTLNLGHIQMNKIPRYTTTAECS